MGRNIHFDGKSQLVKRPRFPNEVIIRPKKSDEYPVVEKDPSTFSLATDESTTAALNTLKDLKDLPK